MFKSILAVIILTISANASAHVFTNMATYDTVQADIINDSTISVNNVQLPVDSKETEVLDGHKIVAYVNNSTNTVIEIDMTLSQYRLALVNGHAHLANGYQG